MFFRANKITGIVSQNGTIRVHVNARGWRIYVAIRFWYEDKQTKEIRPSKKGINVPASGLPELLQTLHVVMDQMVEDGVFTYTDESSPPTYNPRAYPRDFDRTDIGKPKQRRTRRKVLL